MPHDLEFWYAFSPRLRALVGITSIALMLVFCWWGVILPGKTEKRVFETRLVEQRQINQTRWQSLMDLKPPAEPEGIKNESTEAFSPLSFQSTSRQLIRWQPTTTGGEMVLEAQWEQIPHTFLHLADRNMRAESFSLEMKDSLLHFTLQLERDDGG